ncbi:MAG: thioredoxin-disulfide reductase [Candidatus Kapabacteria bacterium]|jgi:thioredoxin reductase (NADPH)|nr:thioredoxin-disulfide reductase [Candidatus Kapabacteria bacterium]
MSHNKIAIIGSGPAGFTAALYASRANLDVTMFEGHQPGGQLTITTEVENYPGFEHGIQGPELMDVMRKQVHRFGAKSVYEIVTALKQTGKTFLLTTERGVEYHADAVILAMGASAKLLGAKGESEYMGYGVSACATCDGFFFRNQDVIVVGGGDTAMEEANYLTRFCKSVTIVHRREEFRASKIMLDRARKNEKISFVLNTIIDEYKGETLPTGMKKMTSVVLRDVRDNSTREMPIDGAFVAIGHQPNSKLVQGLVSMDDGGYVLTEGKSTYTNVPGIFACGDLQDTVYRQAVTAAGSGCMAAIDAERWLEAQH